MKLKSYKGRKKFYYNHWLLFGYIAVSLLIIFAGVLLVRQKTKIAPKAAIRNQFTIEAINARHVSLDWDLGTEATPYVWASNPATDFLLSTENLEIIHHGAETTRIKKLEYIANFPICYDHFKVCWTEKGMANCGHCDKCVRAIISLYMFGRLEKFTTFPKKFNRATTKKWEIKTEIGRYFAREVLTYARQHYPKFARRINRAIIMNHPKNIFRKWILAPLYRASYRAKEKYPFYRRLLSKLRPGY